MSRLCSRFGLRALAIGLLVVGLVGGVALGIDRQTQQRITASGQAAGIEADDMHELKVDQADVWKATAGQRAAQADAQAKANAAAAAAAALGKAADDAARAQAASRSKSRTTAPSSAPFGPIPSSCKAYSGNQAIGCALLSKFGFGLDQMPCLVNLWNRESHWRVDAQNPSGAYGIPQALPGSKMSAFGSDWKTNPATQIKWGLNYIKGRYGTPCAAWQHSQDTGWY